MLARENPFAVHRVLQIRHRLSDRRWAELLERLERLRYRAAIVGEAGRGKTTMLEDLTPRLEARGFRVRQGRVEQGARRLRRALKVSLLAGLTPRDVVLLDSADALSPLEWLALKLRTRRAAGLVVTSRRPGRLSTLVRLDTDPALVDEIVSRLAGREMRDRLPAASELHARHRGDVRAALRELYDFCARIGAGPFAPSA